MNQRIAFMLEALKTLDEGIALFYEYEELYENNPIGKNEKLFKSMRDSMIWRFKHCTDLFWKVIKEQLEVIEKVEIAMQSPRGILREAVLARLLSEKEGDKCMKMVESRNKTSHLYHEEMAEEIARLIPEYYKLIKKVIDRLSI